jgi:hypothetical protein
MGGYGIRAGAAWQKSQEFLVNHLKICPYIGNTVINCMNIRESGQHKFDRLFVFCSLIRLKIGLLIY